MAGQQTKAENFESAADLLAWVEGASAAFSMSCHARQAAARSGAVGAPGAPRVRVGGMALCARRPPERGGRRGRRGHLRRRLLSVLVAEPAAEAAAEAAVVTGVAVVVPSYVPYKPPLEYSQLYLPILDSAQGSQIRNYSDSYYALQRIFTWAHTSLGWVLKSH